MVHVKWYGSVHARYRSVQVFNTASPPQLVFHYQPFGDQMRQDHFKTNTNHVCCKMSMKQISHSNVLSDCINNKDFVQMRVPFYIPTFTIVSMYGNEGLLSNLCLVTHQHLCFIGSS